MQEEIRKRLLQVLDVEDIECKEITKENGVVLYGFAIKSNDKDVIVPIIYADLNKSVEENVRQIVDIFNKQTKKTPFDAKKINSLFRSKDWVLDNIKPCLINREQNKKMLDNVIHSPYVDLEVVYRVDVCHGATCLLTKELAKVLDITLSEAKQAAMNNIAKEIEVVSIVEMLKKSALERGIPEDIVDDMFSEVSTPMYVITTKDGVNGAGAILCSETTARLNEFLGRKMYVFPSSRHEMIAVPKADFNNLDELKELVTTVNATEVSKEDYLSDSVYLWENGFMEVIA